MPRPPYPLSRIMTLVVVISILAASGVDAQDYERSLDTTNSNPMLQGVLGETITGQLRIVPQSRLRDQLMSALPADPIPDHFMEEYHEAVARKIESDDSRPCYRSPESSGDYSPGDIAANSQTVFDVAQANGTVFVGQIEAITAGWDFRYRSVTSLVYVRVDEVLKSRDGLIQGGDLVTYEQPWGSMEIAGVLFCTSPPPGMLSGQAAIGGRRLVVGAEDLNNPLHIVTNSGFLFPVEGSMVHPPPRGRFPQYRDEPVALRELQRVVAP